jgi:photosynthetic reaction center H subunit
MQAGNVVGDLDVAILCVAAFFLFFLGLVWYLRQEDKREGYPLEIQAADGSIRLTEGTPPMPAPKTFYRPHGREPTQAPRAVDTEPSPFVPAGMPMGLGDDPLGNGVGVAAYSTLREDEPDLNIEGEPKIVPLRAWEEYYVAPGDPDPRGWPILGREGSVVGTVTDLWFNRAEFFLRYMEFEIEGDPRTRLAPVFFCEVHTHEKFVRAPMLDAVDLARVPVTKEPTIVTILEEDRINAFFAGGKRYRRHGEGWIAA